MKKILIIALGILIFSSCVKTNHDIKIETKLEAIESLTSYTVPVKSGMTTIVKYNGDTLAVTPSSIMISVPKTAQQKGELVVEYTSDDIYKNFSYGKYWQYLSFEDTKKGDYDYNDIVLHARVKNNRILTNGGIYKYKHEISIQPVALGSSVKIRLGILYKKENTDANVSEAILIEDCRATLFNGIAYFPINTDPTKEIKKITGKLSDFFELTNDSQEFHVVWFIEANGQRMYVATSNFADAKLDMLNADGMPYGISLTQKWDYPVEKCNIKTAYPGFEKWLTSGVENDLLTQKKTKYCFPACPSISSGLTDLWNWEY